MAEKSEVDTTPSGWQDVDTYQPSPTGEWPRVVLILSQVEPGSVMVSVLRSVSFDGRLSFEYNDTEITIRDEEQIKVQPIGAENPV
ncbi:hypothetical protein HUG10_15710 [Halorarum halophilum]|uniref:Halobacterial output domain-containing protein n=1 Tax=Halorarum halophilum TaxID=2743090 RepID=A0A7D5K994_9EURY|nr:hypothetical protein [Halobaculum halophilum]QLG28899.1 hypothetical protein HUG10_15710 [Halobaculum halophilum]